MRLLFAEAKDKAFQNLDAANMEMWITDLAIERSIPIRHIWG
jgi:hypothetical protein